MICRSSRIKTRTSNSQSASAERKIFKWKLNQRLTLKLKVKWNSGFGES